MQKPIKERSKEMVIEFLNDGINKTEYDIKRFKASYDTETYIENIKTLEILKQKVENDEI